jgi:predicted dehydrogenase
MSENPSPGSAPRPPAPPRVGLIGAGHIGAFHSKAIRGVIRAGLVDAEYIGVCDVDPDRAGEFGRMAGLPLVTSDPYALIDDVRINTIYICTPTAEHENLVLRAAAAGKAVFCEKPLMTSLEGAQRMASAVARAGVPNQVGLVLRHAPIFVALKQLMEDPSYGRLMTVVFRDDQFFPITGHYNSSWRKDAVTTGGGTLIEHSIHDLDILTYLCGPVERLTATTRNFAGYPSVEDLALVTLAFEDGATAALTSVWHNVMSRHSTRLLEVFMERAYFCIDQDFLGPIRCETGSGTWVVAQDEVQRRYLDAAGLSDPTEQMALNRWSFEDLLFLRAVARGVAPYPGFDIALEAHRLVDAVYRSAAEGSRSIALGGGA